MSTTPFILQDNQKVSYGINFTDADGNAAAIPAGDTVAVVSSSASCTVAPDASAAAGFAASGFILGSATLGTAQVTATATTAAGAADASIAPAAVSIQVVAGPATGETFTLGTPVSQ